jgi:hypothetical protein
MVYRTPAPRCDEPSRRARGAGLRLAAAALRRRLWSGSLPAAAFAAAALAAAWCGLRRPSLAEAEGYLALGLAYVLSAACARHLWARAPRRPWLDGDELGKKLIWSLALAVPVLGPLFYGALYDPLPPSDVPNRSLRWLGW